MRIKDLVKKCYEASKLKGWYDGKPRETGTILMLIVSELAEAMEEARKRNQAVYFKTMYGLVTSEDLSGSMVLWEGNEMQKPEGELIELADAVIRIMDYCGYKGWDLEQAINAKLEYNQTRPYKHGGKAF